MKSSSRAASPATIYLYVAVLLFGSVSIAQAQPAPANDDVLRLKSETKLAPPSGSTVAECVTYYDSLATKGPEGIGPEADLADVACNHGKGFSKAYAETVRPGQSAGVPPQNAKSLCQDPLPSCDQAAKPKECDEWSKKITVARSKCGASTKTAGFFEPILVAAVGGLGDFLKERAEQELIAYAASVLGKAVCLPKGEVRDFFTVTEQDGKTTRFAFEKSCNTAFPDSEDLDYAAFADGRFQKVFKEEAEALPSFLIDKAIERIPCKAGNDQCVTERGAWRGMLRGVVSYLKPLLHGGRLRKTKAMRELDASIKTELPQGGLCAANSFGPACGALLTLRFGSLVEDQFVDAGGGVLDPVGMLPELRKSFCKDYGVPGEEDACLPQGDLIESVAADVRDAIELLKAAKSETDSNVARGEVIDALRLLFRATFSVAKKVSKNAAGSVALVDCVSSSAEAALALASRDPQAAIVSIKLAVSTLLVAAPALKDALGPAGVRALNFVLDIGGAKDAADAKKIIETAAEPLGSYRVKYEAPLVIALNGFVGPRVGGLFPLNRVAGAESAGFELMPLSGPVGVDFSFRADAQHFGFMLTGIDPLGMVVVEEGGEAHVDWGRVVTPGLLFRWGIQRSPLVLFGGAHYEPLRRPDESPDPNSPAYKGAFFAGGGIAVDIPILIFTARSLR